MNFIGWFLFLSFIFVISCAHENKTYKYDTGWRCVQDHSILYQTREVCGPEEEIKDVK